jgi:hypothetical protein
MLRKSHSLYSRHLTAFYELLEVGTYKISNNLKYRNFPISTSGYFYISLFSLAKTSESAGVKQI